MMNKKILNLMAYFGWVENQSEIDWRNRDIELRRKLEAGEEFEPPWVFAPNTEPWSGEWKQGGGEYWLLEIWLPFWQGLSLEQREKYLEKWEPPTKDWYEYLTIHWIGQDQN